MEAESAEQEEKSVGLLTFEAISNTLFAVMWAVIGFFQSPSLEFFRFLLPGFFLLTAACACCQVVQKKRGGKPNPVPPLLLRLAFMAWSAAAAYFFVTVAVVLDKGPGAKIGQVGLLGGAVVAVAGAILIWRVWAEYDQKAQHHLEDKPE